MRALVLLLAVAALPAIAQDAPADSLVTLTGRVLDAETGAPVVGAGIMVTDLEVGTVSQRGGHFTIPGVTLGPHPVRVGAFRYHMVMLDLEVEAETPMDLALAPGAGVGCAVVHEHGEDGSHMSPREDT
ncbi:carboxypeptidase regulatory-like domain-containing protein [Rubrivirga sp.]|uniref:carboxypeptidase regulatory-like domain-containing protein n=1 Tax=Rubrivirga sp. TaxID=1885344 RepID=UPI003C74387C